jgi:hypothetical protein
MPNGLRPAPRSAQVDQPRDDEENLPYPVRVELGRRIAAQAHQGLDPSVTSQWLGFPKQG